MVVEEVEVVSVELVELVELVWRVVVVLETDVDVAVVDDVVVEGGGGRSVTRATTPMTTAMRPIALRISHRRGSLELGMGPPSTSEILWEEPSYLRSSTFFGVWTSLYTFFGVTASPTVS